MPTAILSALPEEQHGLREQLDAAQHVRHAGRDFHTGRWHGKPVVLALSRIGKVAAATTATALIERFGVQRIVFTGAAGGLHRDVQVGDTVIATEFLQHDMDASPLYPRHEVPLYGRSRFAADDELVGLLWMAASAISSGLFDAATRARFKLEAVGIHKGLLVSGDRFVSAAREALTLQRDLPDALAVDFPAYLTQVAGKQARALISALLPLLD